MSITLYHSGDLGDIIAALPLLRHFGGGKLLIGPGFCRETLRGARFEAIAPLLRVQPYVHGVEWVEAPPAGCKDLSSFRGVYQAHRSLVDAQAVHLGLPEVDTSPWLIAPKVKANRGRVLFARSERYHNGFFPWFALLKRYPEAAFVGTPTEHMAFCEEFRCRIDYLPTANLLELASVLSSSRLFCGNQSCPWWVAFGTGTTTFQESWDHDRNSMIPRSNAYYMTGPSFDLNLLPP